MLHEILRPSELTPDLVKIWNDLLDQDDDLSSPFFACEFAMAVGRCRDDLRIAVFRDSGTITGFLPFHKKIGGCAAPVGGQINDYQGIIGAAVDTGARGNRLLRGCGLTSYDFNHGIATQALFAENAFRFSQSLRADLRGGIDQWQSDVGAKSKQLGKLDRMARKVERDLGELRFEPNDGSDQAWDTFVAWKDAALKEQGASGFPGSDWIEVLLKDIRNIDTPRFAGLFSTLYAGDRMIAAHFGMRSDRAWNWWFPSYDPSMHHYSPGLLLLVRCIKEAVRMGLSELDFGRGKQQYKTQFGTRERQLCEGSFERPDTAFGAIRMVRKSSQRMANKALPEKAALFVHRAGTKLLQAGWI